MPAGWATAGSTGYDALRATGRPTALRLPAGPDGPAQTIDPAAYAWSDAGARGVELEGAVIYELHVATFTAAGTSRRRSTGWTTSSTSGSGWSR